MGLLRDLGLTRKVFDASWNQQPVIAKFFAHPLKAKHHMRKEWRGLEMLTERAVRSPKPLFCGQSDQGGWVVVTEKIADTQTAKEIWDRATGDDEKVHLLCLISRELAGHHSKGILQKDLHLGNFLVLGERALVLDPARIRFLAGPVGKNQALAQLAWLLSFLPGEDDTLAKIYEQYCQARDWEFTKAQMSLLAKKLLQARKSAVKHVLKRCVRTNRRHQRFRYGRWYGLAGRAFFEKVDVQKLVGDIDRVMEDGQILKRGNTCFVSKIELAGVQTVVKRYNHKGIIHSLRHSIKGSRARRCWLHAHRLGVLHIGTPRPLAYFEEYRGPILWKSYLITEYVGGQRLYDVLRERTISEQRRSSAVRQVEQILEKLGEYRITHGDLKHTNILLTETGPVLTDLDGLRVHECRWLYRIQRRKDLAFLADRRESLL
ncbi:MAG: lipopolysaccharide kinase InaA family protein [Planctomycetota bacterium]